MGLVTGMGLQAGVQVLMCVCVDWDREAIIFNLRRHRVENDSATNQIVKDGNRNRDSGGGGGRARSSDPLPRVELKSETVPTAPPSTRLSAHRRAARGWSPFNVATRAGRLLAAGVAAGTALAGFRSAEVELKEFEEVEEAMNVLRRERSHRGV